jgi:aconitate hydratase
MARFAHTLASLTLPSGNTVHYYSLPALAKSGYPGIDRFPFSVKILLESLLRLQPHPAYTEEQVTALAQWAPDRNNNAELPYMPSRVLLQDFTGVPCVVDLAALRSALQQAGHDPAGIEPQIQVDLVIDHSVQIDEYGDARAYAQNLTREFERNEERYAFLKWGQGAFRKLRVLPPGLGICHQVNMEYLASCVATATDPEGRTVAFPDTLVGTDSHTTMVNSMGVLGWGVGGIEAEAAMLGQPIPLLTPVVTGCRLVGELRPTVTPTDLALTVTQRLRERGVVGRFVEFFGPGLERLTLADRAPIANMSPEYGATMGFFPIDASTLEYLRGTGRSPEQIELVEAYCRAQGLFRTPDAPEPICNDVLEIDLGEVEPSVAGPKRPQDRVYIRNLHTEFQRALTKPHAERGFGLAADALRNSADAAPYGTLHHGSVVIAAITSCTNTSNPQLMLGAGLLAKNAVERGLTVPHYVKTSFAPGSRVVTEYLKRAGLLPYLEQLGFHVVAYGCTTCIGNSGPLRPEIEQAIKDSGLVVAAALSGNRNFEGRIHPLTQANYLCSPPLVVAYALKGTVDTDLLNDPIGTDNHGQPVFLKDLWPDRDQVLTHIRTAISPDIYQSLYQDIAGDPIWQGLAGETSSVYPWDPDSTYVREPTYFEGMPPTPPALDDIRDARVLGYYGDFITTDHISPAGAIPLDGPAAAYLQANGVQPDDFNSFGSRRGNHEVMMRGTFANIRIRNQLVDREGGYTRYHPTGETTSIYDAAMQYKQAGIPLVILAGKLYGAGSSRDWAAKGTTLLGARAVIAENFERIHRSNLVEMGVLPLEFPEGQSAPQLGLTGHESFSITGIAHSLSPGKSLPVTATSPDGSTITFHARCRIDSAIEIEYYRHGGILPYVLRQSLPKTPPSP